MRNEVLFFLVAYLRQACMRGIFSFSSFVKQRVRFYSSSDTSTLHACEGFNIFTKEVKRL